MPFTILSQLSSPASKKALALLFSGKIGFKVPRWKSRSDSSKIDLAFPCETRTLKNIILVVLIVPMEFTCQKYDTRCRENILNAGKSINLIFSSSHFPKNKISVIWSQQMSKTFKSSDYSLRISASLVIIPQIRQLNIDYRYLYFELCDKYRNQ